jgi:hypothetical protein
MYISGQPLAGCIAGLSDFHSTQVARTINLFFDEFVHCHHQYLRTRQIV